MTERMRHIAGAAVGLLTHELRHYHLHEVAVALRAISPFRLVVALVLTLLNYVVLSGYDALGLRVVGRPLPYRRTAFASFVSYVIAHNVGASFLGGAAMRLHLYSGWGLSARDVAGVIALNAVTFWLGVLVLLGGALILSPELASFAVPVPAAIARLIGVGCLAVTAAYLVLAAWQISPLGGKRRPLPMPSVRVALAQVALSTADWLLAASVLFV